MSRPIQIFNSLTKKKEPWTPIEPGKVRIYVCGMTVYDYCHVGHARVMVAFDTVARYLRAQGYAVTYIRNITDIDDKIIKRAAERNENIDTLTARFIEAMHEDAAELDVRPPDVEPRATQHLSEIVRMIETLIENGYAYRAANGDVYYRVRKFSNYGALSGKSVDELRIGARVEVDEAKDDPLDFVLWKSAKSGEPAWDAPWGKGRPGWHIECSAMSTACLGQHFDIHGGGLDLKFPHHENEIAQSEGATGKKFVNTWMHVGFVRVNQEKMSKSLGNFFTVREVLRLFKPEVLRYFILASHYRSPLDYSDENLKSAKAALDGFYLALRGLPQVADASQENEYETRFFESMSDDFNTPRALAELAGLTHAINRARQTEDEQEAIRLAGSLRRLGDILGLFQQEPEDYLKEVIVPDSSSSSLLDTEIDALVAQRMQARATKQWAEADHIRDILKEKGVILEDASGQTTWRRE